MELAPEVRMRFVRSLLLVFLSFCWSLPLFAEPGVLPALGIDPKRVSVSGLSSGGFMAMQYGVAHSASVMGVGVVAGGPYDCRRFHDPLTLGWMSAAIAKCMTGAPSAAGSWKAARTFAKAGVIDPVANLKRQRLYLFSGKRDGTVSPPTMKAVRSFYRKARVAAANLLYVDDIPAGHAFISADIGNDDCGATGGHFIDRCLTNTGFYDQPREILGHIYGVLSAPPQTLSAAPEEFDQSRYAHFFAQMALTGRVYIPTSCRLAAGCALHIVFHGCMQSASLIGDDVYTGLGFNKWADGNRIVILYPQVDPTPVNLPGCWDWLGYTGAGFDLPGGPQMAAISAMIAQLEKAP
jgi:poly(3-hydroxybutyrate) depolymerase